ncbi:unnamed protein product [Porites evermanni]|uniref:ADF-H domain-containing protein n=1 Tax=Porites evermanni TaxID=104178 RepID=A0ABN8LTG8_9CNID|nr:unnamed protein product [Porites evermanni]
MAGELISWHSSSGVTKMQRLETMIYASSKDTIKKSFTGLSLEFQANDEGDLDYKALSEEVEKRAF